MKQSRSNPLPRKDVAAVLPITAATVMPYCNVKVMRREDYGLKYGLFQFFVRS